LLIGGIVLGLVLGLVAGGTLSNLATIRLRRAWLLVIAIVVRYTTEALLTANVPIIEALRLPLLTSAFALLLVALWPWQPRFGRRRRWAGTSRAMRIRPAFSSSPSRWRVRLRRSGP
jgi:hypothetical protein